MSIAEQFAAKCCDLNLIAIGMLYRRLADLDPAQDLPDRAQMHAFLVGSDRAQADLELVDEIKSLADLVEEFDPISGKVSWSPDHYSPVMSQGPNSPDIKVRVVWAEQVFNEKQATRERLLPEDGVMCRLWNPESKEFEDEHDEENGTLSYRTLTGNSTLQDVSTMFLLSPAMLFTVNKRVYPKITTTCRLPESAVIILEDDVPDDLYPALREEMASRLRQHTGAAVPPNQKPQIRMAGSRPPSQKLAPIS